MKFEHKKPEENSQRKKKKKKQNNKKNFSQFFFCLLKKRKKKTISTEKTFKNDISNCDTRIETKKKKKKSLYNYPRHAELEIMAYGKYKLRF
jgi:hypothetical protein